MKFTDIVKLKTVIVMFNASKNTLLTYKSYFWQKTYIYQEKIRTDREMFFISIIGPKLWNNYLI